jgi:glutathione-independent formaldehyde dehydrogenase
MKAVVYKAPGKVAVEQVEDPEIQAPTDAVIRITSAGISALDLLLYTDRTAKAAPGMVLGHEVVGVIDRLGPAVATLEDEDRVVLPMNVACGFCINCIKGLNHACLTTNPDKPGAIYGYPDKGSYLGGQAEYIRVPFADFNCVKLPGVPSDQWEDDFLLLSDVFSTGFYAAERALVKPGSTVAVFSAGPIGLMSAYASILKGAIEVYVVDSLQELLDKAKEIGAIPIDYSKSDFVEQIYAWRKNNTNLVHALRTSEAEKMPGVDSGIAADESNSHAINRLAEAVNYAGAVSVAGSVDNLPWKKLSKKGVSVSMGETPVIQYIYNLRNMIIAGQAKPSFIIGKQYTLDEAPLAYDDLVKKKPGHIKVVLKTGLEH